MSTPAGPHARSRLALALAAAAAAAAPTAAAAAPVPAVREARSPSKPGSAPARPSAPVTSAAAPALPVTVSFDAASATPAAWAAHAAATQAPVADDGTVAYHPDAVSDLELVRLSAVGSGARLGVVTSHPGLLHVEWRGGGQRGAVREPVRAGHSQVSLRGLPGASHLRLRATLIPDGDYASSGASGAFKLRPR